MSQFAVCCTDPRLSYGLAGLRMEWCWSKQKPPSQGNRLGGFDTWQFKPERYVGSCLVFVLGDVVFGLYLDCRGHEFLLWYSPIFTYCMYV